MLLPVRQKLGVKLFLLDCLDELIYKSCILLVDVDLITALHHYYYPANHTVIPTINNLSCYQN